MRNRTRRETRGGFSSSFGPSSSSLFAASAAEETGLSVRLELGDDILDGLLVDLERRAHGGSSPTKRVLPRLSWAAILLVTEKDLARRGAGDSFVRPWLALSARKGVG